MALKYVFREPLTIPNAKKADPQTIGESLAEIERKSGGHLKPRRVWQEAEATNHPLHAYFEWDDAEAAKAYRDEQARTLIRSVKIIDENDEDRPAYFSVQEKNGRSYRSYGDVMASEDLQIAVLRNAERDLEAWESRYKAIHDACELVTEARSRVRRRRERAESRPRA